MQYLKVMSISVLLFTAVGSLVGFAACEMIGGTDEQVRLLILLAPIGVGAGTGLFIGLAASLLTAIAGPTREAPPRDAARAP